MKHSNTKLSNPRRIAAHLLTTSAIAILGVQTAGAVTVFNPTVTGVSDISGACRVSVRAQLFKTPGEDYRLEIHNNGRIVAKIVPLAPTGNSGLVDNQFIDIPDSVVQHLSQGNMQVKWAADNSAKQPRGTANVQTSALTTAGGTCADVATALTTPPNPNVAPTSNAGPDQAFSNTASDVTLDGTGSSDPDGDNLTYAWTQISGPTLSLVAVTTKASNAATVARPTYRGPQANAVTVFQLIVNDGTVNSPADTVTITWGANGAPVANAGADQNLVADFTGGGTAQTVTVDAAASSDPDGDTLTYAWSQISGPATTRVVSSRRDTALKIKVVVGSPATAVFSQPATVGTVVYRVTVTDPSGDTDTDDISVVWSANTPPTTTAPSVQNPSGPVLVGSNVPLSSGTSTSTSGNPVTYSWVQTGGPSVTLDNPNSPNPTFPAPAAGGAVTFVLTVSDGISTTTQTVTVNLVIDQTPVANAGPDQTFVDVAKGTVVTLDGTSSIDPDGGTLTYAWSQVSGASVTLSSTTAAQPTFTYPSGGGGGGVSKQKGGTDKGLPVDTLVFELVVSDGASTSAADQVTITINTNDVPTADAGVDQTFFGLVNGDTFTLAGSGTDPDGDTLTYVWTQTAGRSLTLSDSTSAAPTVTFDGSYSAGANEVFTYSLIVNDGSTNSVADTVTFTLVENRAPIADAGTDQNGINAGELVTLTGGGSSDADGDTLTYTWSQVSGPIAALSSTTAESPTFTAPDVTGAATLVYQLIVSDGKETSIADTVSIGVQPTGTITIIQNVQGSDNSFAFSSPITALNASLQTSGGTGQLFADDVNTGTYTVTAEDMKSQGYALTNLFCNDGDSSVDVSGRTATITLSPGENVTCTFTSVNSREAATIAIQEYLTVRNALILSHQPSRGRRLDRLKGQSASGSITAGGLALPGSSRLPVQVAMNGSDASFATSLSSARAAGGSPNAGKGSIDVWGEAQLSNFDAAGRDGHFSIYYAGVDYLVSDKVLIGGLVQLDKFKQSGAGGTGGVGAGDGDGYMVGPYVTARISDNIYVDARAAWGKSDNSISPLGTFVDEFDTSRMLYSGSVTGEFALSGNMKLQPTLSVRHLGETQRVMLIA